MSTIGTSIELYDRVSAPMFAITNALQMTISGFDSLQSSMSESFDSSNIQDIRDYINEATMSIMGLEDALSGVFENGVSSPEIPVPTLPTTEPIEIPVTWNTQQRLDIFNESGIARYEQEMQSVNDMLMRVNSNQERIADISSQVDVFPREMLTDVQGLDYRIQELANHITAIENNPIDDIGANVINRDLEGLRGQLLQAITLQNDLTSAMERMDISSANQAYNRLNSVVDSTDRYIRDNMNAQDRFNDSIESSGSLLDGATNKIMGMAAAYASIRTVGEVFDLSDSVMQTEARLSMIVDDGGSVGELEQLLYDSAERSRSSYQDTADVVAKLSLNAGDAFGSNAETIQFAENLNKQFVIAGASQQEMQSASMQLTQALGSGVLRGEELNAVFEAAPNVIQTIADYMDVPISQIREMASEGLITGDIVKNAMLSATDSINTQFESMPMTFSQSWTSIQNDMLATFQPLLETIAMGATFIHDNWSIIEPVFWGLTAAVGAYALITGIQTAATWLSVAANQALIVTMLSNPVMWIALAIGVLIGIIYRWVESVGGIRVAWKIAMNAILTTWDIVKIGLFTGIYAVMNKFNEFQLNFMQVSTNIQNYMGDMKSGVLMTMQNMVNGAIDIMNDFIDTLNNIPGVSIDAIAQVSFGANAALENQYEQATRNAALQDYTDEINAQISARDEALNQMQNQALTDRMERQLEIETLQVNASVSNDPYSEGGTYAMGTTLNEIAENTSSMSDSLDASAEDLKYILDLAEVDAVNKFTTAEIKIEQTNHNTIKNGQDIDGVTNSLTSGLNEAIEKSTEGVHD